MKKLTQLAAAVALTAGAVAATPAMAEVSASVGVASTYLWRGYDLGSGTPAISGDLSYSAAGFYTGIWGSSGDTSAGTEFDLYAGYGMEFESGFFFDLSVWNYVYPTGAGYTVDGETDIGDLTDVILSVGFGPVAFSYYQPVAGACGGEPSTGCSNSYNYYSVSGELGSFSATLGMHDNDDDDPMHLDISYAYNDNLSFTFSQFVSDEPEGDDLKFVVSYSMPIE